MPNTEHTKHGTGKKRAKIDEAPVANFEHLPDELIVYLFSFIPEATSMREVFNKLAQLSLVDRKFKQIAEDQYLINELAKRFIKVHPQAAGNELLTYGGIILRGEHSKQNFKVVAALAKSIDTDIKNNILVKASTVGRF